MAYYRKRSAGWRAEVAILGVRVSETWPTKAQAVAWAVDTESRIRAGQHAAPASAGEKLTVHALIHRYIEQILPTRKGADKDRIRLLRFARELPWAGVLASAVTPAQLIAWRDQRLGEAAPASVNRELNLLSALFEYARADLRACASNPVRECRRPKHPPPRDRPILEAEIDAMLAALRYERETPPDTAQHRVALAFLFALETGMRAGEIVGLRWADVHRDKCYAVLADSKNGDSRQVPLSSAALRLLSLLPRQGDGAACFDIRSGSLDALWRKARQRAQANCPSVASLHFHDSRHEATTRLARKLGPLDLARMIGHRDLNSLMFYYNPTASDIAARLG